MGLRVGAARTIRFVKDYSSHYISDKEMLPRGENSSLCRQSHCPETLNTLSDTGHTIMDVESGQRDGHEGKEDVNEVTCRSNVKKAKDKFRGALQKVFSEADRVDQIMSGIGDWEFGL